MSTNNIQTSGGIFTHHFIESIQQETVNHPSLNAETFTFDYQERINERTLESRIAEAWTNLVDRWDAVEREFNSLDITTFRQKWLRPLFYQLGFNLEFNKGDIVLDDDFRFPISHLGRAGTTEITIPIHNVLYKDDSTLESKAIAGRGIKAMAPHDMLQRYLNLSKEHKWGIVCDGVFLRLLRDFHHSYTRGYTEFNLQDIFSTRDFAGFRTMYRLLHASRFVISEGKDSTAIENLYEDALAMGVAVGNKLRDNVQAAIETLAKGFLVSTPGFLEAVKARTDGAQQLYHDILITIYRILFLLFAEQRGMLPGRGSLYHDEFSLTALRTLAEQPRGDDSHYDLWEKLKLTFSMVEHGVAQLKIFPYNGALFSMKRTSLLTPYNPETTPRCRNEDLLTTIRHLTTVEQDQVLQRISYSDLSVEEIGSIYESLLEITPRISDSSLVVDSKEILPNTFYLDPRGKGRKTTGSYYTPPSLVNELIKSALEPVMFDRLRDVVPGYESDMVEALKDSEHSVAEEALLKIKVVDPASGSGAFLIAANNRLALELARIRSGSIFPPDSILRHARRDVLTHCIHGVDLNPMAVELCKVSLWINAAVEDAPLNFLDHHIQCGNSLVGATPELIKMGIPDEAYNPVTGDDKALASSLKRQNRHARQGQDSFVFKVTELYDQEALQKWILARDLAESEPAKAEKAYKEYETSQEKWDERLPYDLWTAAFFIPLQQGHSIPTSQHVRQARIDPKLIPLEMKKQTRQLVEEHHFFHWHLAFPEIFDNEGKGGFDVVLCNPPWELINLVEKEYFEGKDDSIVEARTGADRKKLIKKISESNPALWSSYCYALRTSESLAKFLNESQAFPLSSQGRTNTYPLFSEKAKQILSLEGRVGIIVPSGIATDFYNKDFFSSLVKESVLVSMYDFENRRRLFPDVGSIMKFCLLTFTGQNTKSSEMSFSFFLLHPNDMLEGGRIFQLTKSEFELLNPNTLTCPVFENRETANLTLKIYRQAPILINEVKGENQWGISFQQGIFNMTSDSDKFQTYEELLSKGYSLYGSIFKDEQKNQKLPLYEAKLLNLYDHRTGTFLGVPSNNRFVTKANTIRFTDLDKQNPSTVTIPRYWVDKKEIDARWSGNKNFLILFRNVIQMMTNARCAMFAITPLVGVGNSAPILQTTKSTEASLMLLANLNSFIFDFEARQSIGGGNFNFYIIKQLVAFPPEKYSKDLESFILPRVFELTYSCWNLQEFANEIWNQITSELRELLINQRNQNAKQTEVASSEIVLPIWAQQLTQYGCPFPPFIWHKERRFHLLCDLDALFGHLYNLTHDEFDYILETFPIVKRSDEAHYGEFRTKRVILEKFDAMADSPMLVGACIPLAERVSVLKNPPQTQASPLPQVKSERVIPPASPVVIERTESQSVKSPPVIQENQHTLFDTSTKTEEEPGPTLSDYTLYRCPLCDTHLLGLALEAHTRDIHKGNDPGYLKVSKGK